MSCGLQDVMELESLGTPAVLVGHPIQDRTDAEMQAMAREAVDALLAAVS